MNNINKYLLLLLVILKASIVNNLHSQDTGENNSEFINQFFPERMDTSKQYSVWITMKNTGLSSWSSVTSSKENQYRLSIVSDAANDTDNTFGDVLSVFLNQSVDPGQSAIIKFIVTAPSKAGSYTSQWRMMQGSKYFGEQTKSVFIKVNEEDESIVKINAASFVKQSVPNIMKSNFKSAVSLTVENTGNTKWVPDIFF